MMRTPHLIAALLLALPTVVAHAEDTTPAPAPAEAAAPITLRGTVTDP
jgi:hypothetical protein